MQTGSGVSHEEETVGEHNEFFQIWFEPNLKETVHHTPTYAEFRHEDFPLEVRDGVTLKHVIGNGAPVSILAEASMQDVLIPSGLGCRRELSANRTLAMVVINGKGALGDDADTEQHALAPKYFAVVHAGEAGSIAIRADQAVPLRLAMIEVPAQVEYPLYQKSGNW